MIVDTNALSDLLEGRPEMRTAVGRAATLQIPVVVLGEYRYGLLHSRLRKVYEATLEGLLADVEILPIDPVTAEYYALVRSELRRAGRPIPANDAWIAALARQHVQPILSRDAHFDAVPGVTRIGW